MRRDVRPWLAGPPAAVSICHCVNCRKLSGAPFTAQAVAKMTQVNVTRADGVGELVGFSSSPAVERFRCPQCLSPVYASLAKGKMAAVPLSILSGGDVVIGVKAGQAGAGGEERVDISETPSTSEEGRPSSGCAPLLRATHHMYYGDRIIDVPDDLPKYVKSSARQAQLWTPDLTDPPRAGGADVRV